MKVTLQILKRFKGYGAIDEIPKNKDQKSLLKKITSLVSSKFAGEMAPLLPKGALGPKYS
ncbi:MAG: hypothetical protein K1060chlam4_00660 [Candidatus Anoxychlamydiales bacterium]|nr:hypothetical protein [Candidatus Anoxychlamydiales bacterium]